LPLIIDKHFIEKEREQEQEQEKIIANAISAAKAAELKAIQANKEAQEAIQAQKEEAAARAERALKEAPEKALSVIQNIYCNEP